MLPIVAGIAGSMLGGMYSDYRARKEADKNRNFQADMSNTSHQREVQDLRAAGLNPILSANSGASTPSGATAGNADMSGMGTTALDSMRLKQDIKNLQAQEKLTQATEERERATAKNLRDSNRGIKAESETKGTMLDKVLQGMGITNTAQEAFSNSDVKVEQKGVKPNPNSKKWENIWLEKQKNLQLKTKD